MRGTRRIQQEWIAHALSPHSSPEGLWGMYKRSEPIKLLHSVQNHMANVYSSEVCLQTKNFPKISKFFFPKTVPKYDKLSKINNISIKTILKLRTKFGNFGNFGHISDRLRTIHNTCSNLIGSEPLYILPTGSATEAETFGYFLVYFHIIHLWSYDITIDLKGIINTFDNMDKQRSEYNYYFAKKRSNIFLPEV